MIENQFLAFVYYYAPLLGLVGVYFILKKLLSAEQDKLMHYSMRLLSYCVLAYYVRVTVWRPDLAGLDGVMGDWYLPWWNVLSVAVVGTVLVFVTRNVLFSLLVGAISTLILTPIDLRIFWNLIVDCPGTRVTYYPWFILASVILVFARYHGKFIVIEKKKVCKKIIVVSFLVYIGIYVLLFFFHELLAPTWLAVLRSGVSDYSPTMAGKISAVGLKTAGYLFYSLGITYIIVRKNE